jgi:RNA polymerase sigma-70 factor (ECF subfamily)
MVEAVAFPKPSISLLAAVDVGSDGARSGACPSAVGIWLRSAFRDGAAAEFPPAVVALLDRLEAGGGIAAPEDAAPEAAAPEAAVRHALSDRDFRRELEGAIPRLRAFGRGLARDPEAADDLLQETLMKAWAARARFEAGTSMIGWTCTILRNLFYSEMRRGKFRAEWNDVVADRLLVTKPAQQDAVDLADLYRALDHVPRAQREALLLVGAAGLAYEDAAAACGCAVGTIKSRVSRGRATLQLVLDGGTMAPRAADATRSSTLDTIMAEVRELERMHG